MSKILTMEVALLVFLLASNVFDGLATAFGYWCGFIFEANPIMNFLLGHGIVYFLTWKLVVTSFIILILYRYIKYPSVKRVWCVVAVVMLAISGLHTYNLYKAHDLGVLQTCFQEEE